jgi:hypothetical protein
MIWMVALWLIVFESGNWRYVLLQEGPSEKQILSLLVPSCEVSSMAACKDFHGDDRVKKLP